MKPTFLTFCGFKSFAAPTVFRFPEKVGLFLVRGKNKAEPTLGANGVGKSTLFDAVCWCLYGKTVRGVSGPSVESWNGDGSRTYVDLGIKINTNEHIISRWRNPNSLTLDGVTVAQHVIDDLLGVDYNRFLHVVLLGQFGTLFADLQPSHRLSLLDGILDLSKWATAAQNAKDKLKQLRLDQEVYAKSLHGLQEREAALDEALATAEAAMGAQAKLRLQELARINTDREELIVAHLACRVEIDKLSGDIEKREQQRSENERELGGLELERRKYRQLADRLVGKIDSLKGVRQKIAVRVEKLAKLKGTQCSACGQSVKAEQVKMFNKTLTLEATNCQVEMSEITEQREIHFKRIRKLTKQIDELDATDRQALQVLGQKQRVLKQKTLERNKLSFSLDALEKSEAKLQKVTSSDETVQQSLERKLNVLQEEVAEAEVLYYDAVTQTELVEYWPNGFKELKLWIIESALQELEVYINSSLVELGLVGWKVTLVTKRESAARGALEILVVSPTSPVKVPWESWSGGETQRLRIACAVGLAELAKARMLNPPLFEVWDEPTAHLDQSGVQDVIAFFDARAEDKQVWIVDHRSLDSGYFDASVLVVKEKTTSILR